MIGKLLITNDYSVSKESLVQATTNDFGRSVASVLNRQADDATTSTQLTILAPIFPAWGLANKMQQATEITMNATTYAMPSTTAIGLLHGRPSMALRGECL